MKKAYITPKADFVTFQIEDVITVSTVTTTTTTQPQEINASSMNRDLEMV